MIFPFESLSGAYEQFGLVIAVAIGFCFGFVLERAGFGRATKLAAQFYLYDMTVFKVMFTAIVTAMLGVVLADGLGLADFGHVAELAVSETYLWPMIFGGLLLGVGFIISGYCPGTSLVSAASGHIDGMLTFLGVIVGSVLFGEMYPWVAKFYLSGQMGQVFLHQLLGVPPAVVALAVTVMAVGCFLGAEWVERWASRRILGLAKAPESPATPRRITFGYFAAAAALGLAFLFLPVRIGQAKTDGKKIESIGVVTLAHRVIEEPWRLRIIDLRSEEAFLEQRIPGSEHVSPEQLNEIGLQYSRGIRDLVLVGEGDLAVESLPEVVRLYPGRVFVLEGGFAAWRQFALTPPPPLRNDASARERQAYQFRAGLHAALTGAPAPPPPTSTVKFKAPPKRKGGGCS